MKNLTLSKARADSVLAYVLRKYPALPSEQFTVKGYGLTKPLAPNTNDLNRAHRVIVRLEAGTCWINHFNVTPIELPFGGVKLSGLGRENGRIAMEHYTQLKSVYVAKGDIDAPY